MSSDCAPKKVVHAEKLDRLQSQPGVANGEPSDLAALTLDEGARRNAGNPVFKDDEKASTPNTEEKLIEFAQSASCDKFQAVLTAVPELEQLAGIAQGAIAAGYRDREDRF